MSRGKGRLPAISIQAINPEQFEGAKWDAPTVFSFIVSREDGGRRETTVDWAVSGVGRNGAEAADFAGGAFPSGTLTFAAGERHKVITVEVRGDFTPEGAETFRVRLKGDDAEMHIEKAAARATILDDDALVTTLALGEEGDDGGPIYTTLAIGEEGDEDPIATTRALGEEGDDGDPIYTTLALGEEGDDPAPILAPETPPGDLITTHAIGEEGDEGIVTEGLPGTGTVQEDGSPFGA